MKHINITDKSQCCGCTACASICAHNAITMRPDALGFMFPEVDESKCVECGLCEKVCAFHPDYDQSLNLPQPEACGVRHKELSEIERSQSGGAFVLLTDYFINGLQGVIYGVGYKGYFRAAHKRAETIEERNEFRGSKYVQSDLAGVFKQVKNDLKAGRKVCFSGTPCQVAGLASFIGKKLRANLYLIDIVCHGVPAPKVWEDYLQHIEEKENDKIIAVNFRDKKPGGWHSFIQTFTFSGRKIHPDTYIHIYDSALSVRHSCNVCHYTNMARPSDVTIGDLWGVEKIDSRFAADNRGCSLLLANTEKGREWFEKIKHRADLLPIRHLDDCKQPQLCHPSAPNPLRNAFEADYAQHGFKQTMTKYGFIGYKNQLRKYAGYPFRLAKRILRRLLP